MSADEWAWWEDEPMWLDEDKPRCELDHKDGGVCLRVLRRDWSCPGEKDHAPDEVTT